MVHIIRYLKSFLNFKNLLSLICLLCLFLQTIELFDNFMGGKTVPNMSVGRIDNDTFPAITFCPSKVDFGKMAKMNRNISLSYDEYSKIFMNKSLNKDIKKKLMENLYMDSIPQIYPPFLSSCNVKECFLDNLTPLYNNLNVPIISPQLAEKIQRDIDGKMLNPIESIQIYNRPWKFDPAVKCFTYFSHFQLFWEKIEIERSTVLIFILKLDDLSFPYRGIEFSIHSPNSLPLDHDTNSINPDSNYRVSYSKWKVERLGKGYDTDCKIYDTKVFSRNDCIFKCYQQKMEKICKTSGFFNSYLYTRIEFFENKNLSWINCQHISNILDQEENAFLLCDKQCPLECHFTYYFTTIEKSKFPFESYIFMTFSHGSMPDIYIRHIPEMPLMTFICNFGGILGMWLGVAFIDILQYFRLKFMRIHNTYQSCFNTFIQPVNNFVYLTNNNLQFIVNRFAH